MADVKIIGVPCIDSCLNSLEGDLSKYVDEGYIITGQCITPQGNIIYTLVKNTEENKIVPVPIKKVASEPHYVPTDSDIVQAAREIGICFGD